MWRKSANRKHIGFSWEIYGFSPVYMVISRFTDNSNGPKPIKSNNALGIAVYICAFS